MNDSYRQYKLQRQRERNLHNKYKRIIEKYFIGKEVLIKDKNKKAIKGIVKNLSGSVDFLTILTEREGEVVVEKRYLKEINKIEQTI